MNKRKNTFLLAIAIMLIMSMVPLKSMAAESKIIFNDETGIPDTVLYRKILSNLDKDDNSTFTEKEAAEITSLEADGDGDYDECTIKLNKITTLKGIEYLKNLTYLDVSSNRISSIIELRRLRKLKLLNVSNNQLKSLNGIEGLKRLKTLEVTNNQLKSLSGVENLINLSDIDAGGNQLQNIRPLKNLVNLEAISVNANQISSIKEIKKFKKLKFIYAYGNKLKSLPNLNKYKKMMEFDFASNYLSKKEIKNKYPVRYRKTDWFKDQIQFQSIVKNITPISPKTLDNISVKTKEIIGKANKNATIVLRDPYGKKITSVKSDSKGKFIFKRLNLKKWSGQMLSLKAYLEDRVNGERLTLKIVRFTVLN